MFFIISLLLGIFFIGQGIYCIKSKKEVAFGFWTNGKKPQIEEKNIKAYNKDLGKLYSAFGFFIILLVTPLLGAEQNSPLYIISAIGLILGVIMLMTIYTMKIERKYKKK